MLIPFVGFLGAATIALSFVVATPASADDGIGTGAWSSVSSLSEGAGALLAVGTRQASSPADATRPVGPAAAVAVATGAPVPEQPAAGSANVGAGTGSGVGCVSALSDIPQTQPGGAYYDFHCLGAAAGVGTNRQSQGTVWIPNQVAGTGPLPAAPAPVPLPPPAAVLAREAADQLLLPAPDVEVSPQADHDQVVDFPTWLWLGAGSFAARSRTVTVPGESVTATAVPVSVSWTMGDGSTVTCAGPGTPYTPATPPLSRSPDCGHTYLRPSIGQPGDRYPVTVTARWQISWAGAGRAGVLPDLLRTATTSFRVAEVQTVNS